MRKICCNLVFLCAALVVSCVNPAGGAVNGGTNDAATSSVASAICIYNGKIYVAGFYVANGVSKP